MIAERPEIERKIEHWKATLTEYQPLVPYDRDRLYLHVLPQVDVLIEIFEEIKNRAKLKVKWKKVSYSAWGEYMEAAQQTTKIGCSFRMVSHFGYLSLNAYLRHSAYLRYATDEFWIEVAKLCEETPVKWETTEFPRNSDENKIKRSLFRQDKSVFFSMMRNYLLGTELEKDNRGIGDFRLEWASDGDWLKMLEQGAVALRRIYNLNYHLWRWHYQTVHRTIKKDSKEQGYDFKEAMKHLFPDDETQEAEG